MGKGLETFRVDFALIFVQDERIQLSISSLVRVERARVEWPKEKRNPRPFPQKKECIQHRSPRYRPGLISVVHKNTAPYPLPR